MKILYGAPASVFVRKSRILLVEKGINFIIDPVNPMLPLEEYFKKISPLGKIPVFQDEDYVLTDSSAICAYIDKKYPQSQCCFYPNNPEALGLALWFEEYADTVLFEAIAACYYQMVLAPLYRNRSPDCKKIEEALEVRLPPVANYLEKMIGNNEFLVANCFTIADVAITSVFLNMIFSGFSISKEKWPNLYHYLFRNFQRPSFKSCISEVEFEFSRAQQFIINAI